MRIIVFFDLPVKTKKQKRDYIRFRTFLLNEGYDMLQYSVYCRICNSHEATQKHLNRIQKNLPPKGAIRAMTVTEKQYAQMKFLLGDPTPTERKIATSQLTLF